MCTIKSLMDTYYSKVRKIAANNHTVVGSMNFEIDIHRQGLSSFQNFNLSNPMRKQPSHNTATKAIV